MIRPATLADLARLNELVREMHARSIYSELALAEATMRSILMDGVRRHGGTHAGSTLLNVVEFRGKVEGFMLGILQRLYLICEPLEAIDFWLYCSPKAPAIGAPKLIDAYIDWTAANPKVHEVKLSWTDALKIDPAKIGKLYARKGFVRVGEIWRRS